MLAAFTGQEAVARLLLSKGADLFARTLNDGTTPVAAAITAKNYIIAQLLVDSGSDLSYVDREGGTLLHYAAFAGPPESVQMLLEKGLSIKARDNRGATPLHEAAASGSVAVMKMLIESGADLNEVCKEYGETALDIARKMEHQALVEYLEGIIGGST
jgi:ankyrin repeat protein